MKVAKQKDESQPANRETITAILRSLDGEPITARMLSIKLKTGEAAIKHIADGMVLDGAARSVRMSKSTIDYYMPNKRQQESEEKARQAVVHKALQPRTAHAEAVARAKAVREQIRSIG